MLKEKVKKIVTFVNDHKGDIIQWISLVVIMVRGIDVISDKIGSFKWKIKDRDKARTIDLMERMDADGYAEFYTKSKFAGDGKISTTARMAYNDYMYKTKYGKE